MIDQKQITNDKLPFVLPKLAVLILILFFVYIDLLFVNSSFHIKALNRLSVFNIIVFIVTLTAGLDILKSEPKLFLLSNNSGVFLYLERALFCNKFRVKNSTKIMEIKTVSIENAQEIRKSNYYGGCFYLIIKDTNDNIIFNKIYDDYDTVNNDAQKIKDIIDGNEENFEITDEEYSPYPWHYEYNILLIIMVQFAVNYNYIKQIFFGA